MKNGKNYEATESALVITKTKEQTGEKERRCLTILEMIKEGFSEYLSKQALSVRCRSV